MNRRNWWALVSILLIAGGVWLFVVAHSTGEHAVASARTRVDVPSPSSPSGATHSDSVERANVAVESVNVDAPQHLSSTNESRVSFVFDDGAPVANAAIRTAYQAIASAEREVADIKPDWSQHLDGAGEIAVLSLEKFGAIAAIRLDEHFEVLVPLDLSKTTRYELPRPVATSISLSRNLVGLQHVRVVLFSKALWSFYQPFNVYHFKGGPFADLATLRETRQNGIEAIGDTPLDWDASSRHLTANVPLGAYYLKCIESPIGWWIDEHFLDVTGGDVQVALYPVPVVEFDLPTNDAGEPRVPIDVRVAMQNVGGGGAEIPMPFEVSGSHCSVSMRVATSSDGCTYAVRVYWSDKLTSTTKFGPLDQLRGELRVPSETEVVR